MKKLVFGALALALVLGMPATTASAQVNHNGPVEITPDGTGGGLGIGFAPGNRPLWIKVTSQPKAALAVRNLADINVFQMTLNSAGDAFLDIRTAGNVKNVSLNSNGVSFLKGGAVGIGKTPNVAIPLDVEGKIQTSGTLSAAIVEIRGSGNDLAEGFRISTPGEKIMPGMVVAIDPATAGGMMLSEKSYNRMVAGIISGAGDRHVGLQLGNAEEVAAGELHPVALTGQVWCYVDTAYGAVAPGDLLTTSDTIGHAMKVSDFAQAQGAIIGKAMTPLENGKGLVLVLVSLQ